MASGRTVLVLGGYGETGRRVAGLLAERAGLPLVLAGRDAARAEAMAEELHHRFPEAQVAGLGLDAGDGSSLGRALEGMALLVNATTGAVPGAAVARAAVDAGADVVDLQFPVWADSGLAARAEAAGRCVVTQAGFHPGVPAALVRWAAARVEILGSAWVAGLLRPAGGLPYTPAVDDLIRSFRGYRPHVYGDGAWRPVRMTDRGAMPSVWFDFGFGRQWTAAWDLDEMLALPELIPSLGRVGFSVAGFDPVTDTVMSLLIMAALSLWGRRSVAPLSKLLCWSTRSFGRAPFGIVVQLEAEGTTASGPVKLRLGLFHEDGYDMTAIPAVSMIEQVLDGTARTPGLRPMGLAADPDRLLADVSTMGVRVRLLGAGALEGLGGAPTGGRRPRSRPSSPAGC